MRRRLPLITTAALLTVTAGSSAEAGGARSPDVVVSFDAARAELPEGVALDKAGNTYVGLGPPFFVGGGYGAVQQIARDGTRTTLVEFPDGPAVAGLAVDARGTVYFALPNPGQPDTGVYRVTESGAVRLPGTEDMLVPNGLAIGRRGDLYASDSILGEIWRIPRHGHVASTWLADDLLAGCPGQIGANGIAFWRGDLYVANTSKGLLVRVPVAPDGTPSEPQIVAGDTDCDPTDELFSMDGIAFDVHGQIYALLVLVHDLVRIDPDDGTVTPLLDEDDGLWNPASLAFGTGRGDRTSLFIANYAVLPPAPDGHLGPAILQVDVGAPGLPLP